MPFFWSQWYQSGSTGIPSGALPAPSGTLGVPWLRSGPETRLPHWMLARWAASGLLFGLLQTVAEAVVPVRERLGKSRRGLMLSTLDLDDTRLEWRLPKSLPHPTDLVFTYQASSLDGPVSGTITGARSLFDWLTRPDPTWVWDPQLGQIRIRNLATKQLQQESGTGVYTIPGESRGVIPDAGIYYRRHPAQEWEWLSAAAPAASGTAFSLPVSGVWLFRYGSLSALEALETGTVTMRWPGGQSVPLPLTRILPDNHLDAWGQLLQIPRLQEEDDLAYQRRLLIEVQAPPSATLPGVTRGIAGRIGRLAMVTWDGLTPLTLDAAGSTNITQVTLPTLLQTLSVQEFLTPVVEGRQYAATYPNWLPGWQVTAAGLPARDATVSGNIVTFGTAVSGQVLGIYAIRRWSVTRGPSGQITGLTPGTGIASGSYPVLVSRDVRLTVLDLPETLRDRLLDASGQPADLFAGVAEQLARESRSTVGRSRWGTATWLPKAATPKAVAHLPLPFDSFSLGPSGFAH